MSKMLFKDFLREIRHSMGRFLSIFTIVLIGVSFFSGIKAAAPDMKHSADKYYDKYNLMDIRVLSTLGLSKDDIQEISKIQEIEKVQGGYFVDAVSMIGSTEIVFRLHSLPTSSKEGNGEGYINEINLLEGQVPSKSGECLIEESNAIDLGLKIGDTIKLTSGKDVPITDEALNRDTFTIVGKTLSPNYLSYEKGPSDIGNGRVSLYLMIPEEDFKYSVYTEALVTVKGAKELNTYKKDYENTVEKVLSSLENLGVDRSAVRLNEIKDEVNKKLQEAREEYNKEKQLYDEEIKKGEEELNAAYTKLVQGESTLKEEKENYKVNIAAAEKAIKEGEKDLAEGEAQYAAALKEYNDTMAKYGKDLEDLNRTIGQINALRASAQNQINQLEKELNDPNLTEEERAEKKQLLDSYKALIGTLDDELKTANELNNYLQTQPGNAKKELDQARRTLDEGKAELSKAKKDLASSKSEANSKFAKAEKDLENGWKEYDAAKKLFEEKKLEGAQKLSEGNEAIIRGENELERISKPQWYVLDRTSNYGYMDFKLTAERIDGIANVFPIFFFLVAALVCLTTMTRMIDEQRINIGTYKAIGYSNSSIALKYIMYAALASSLGGTLGIIVGRRIFPDVIFNAYSMMYTLPSLDHVSQPILMAISLLMGILVTTLASFGACYKELMELPAMLLRPKSPKAGKKILLEKIDLLWKHLTFSQKVTARNLFRYKKRLYMTLTGIAGCAALLLSGFGLSNSIGQIVNKQYKEIFNYNLNIRYAADASKEAKTEALSSLEKSNYFKSYSECAQINASMNSGEKDIAVTLIIPDSKDNFNDYIILRDRSSGDSLPLKDKGIIISEKLSKELKVNVGDSIELDNKDGFKKKVEVSAITENYVYHYAYMSKEAYKEIFRLPKENNSLLVKLSETSPEIENEIGRKLIKNPGVASVTFYSSVASDFKDQIKSLDSIVYVIILCAGLLAFVVLYNLTNINIGERIREIATIKVLGFYNREVSSYVYRENIILSLMGASIGLVLGIFLHKYIMVSLEQDGIMFGNYIKPISFLYSFLITIIFSLIVNIVMYKRLTGIPMVESLKSIE
ncbi:MAG: FtsX-like permease family protein [Clostridiaceae bacterium]